jgi:hypothetical protein
MELENVFLCNRSAPICRNFADLSALLCRRIRPFNSPTSGKAITPLGLNACEIPPRQPSRGLASEGADFLSRSVPAVPEAQKPIYPKSSHLRTFNLVGRLYLHYRGGIY